VIQGDPNAMGFHRACGPRSVGSKPSASIAGRRLPLLELRLGVGTRDFQHKSR
jgi:hypothetical protein